MTDTQDDIHVRVASARDEEGMMVLYRLAHAENGIFPMSDGKVRSFLRAALNRENGIIGVIGPTDALEGCIHLCVDCHWYSDQPFMLELINFVHPEHRGGGGRARKLLDFGKKCSDEMFPMIIGIISNKQTEAKVRLYRRQFGEPAGAWFLYGARTGQAPLANGQA